MQGKINTDPEGLESDFFLSLSKIEADVAEPERSLILIFRATLPTFLYIHQISICGDFSLHNG